MSKFIKGQPVKVTETHNHFTASTETVYHVGQIDRFGGRYSIVLLLNGICVGACPESKLSGLK